MDMKNTRLEKKLTAALSDRFWIISLWKKMIIRKAFITLI